MAMRLRADKTVVQVRCSALGVVAIGVIVAAVAMRMTERADKCVRRQRARTHICATAARVVVAAVLMTVRQSAK